MTLQDLIKINNKDEKELVLDYLNKKNTKWASGEEANCERMKKVIPNESYLVIVDNQLYWETVERIEEFYDEVFDKIKTVDEFVFVKSLKGLPDVDLTLIRVRYGEEDKILNHLASLNIRWSKGQLANEWRVARENIDDDEYYLMILNKRNLTWGEVNSIKNNPEWELYLDMKNIESEEHLEAEEFIERFVK